MKDDTKMNDRCLLTTNHTNQHERGKVGSRKLFVVRGLNIFWQFPRHCLENLRIITQSSHRTKGTRRGGKDE